MNNTDEETYLLRSALSRATGLLESYMREHIMDGNLNQAEHTLTNLIWLHKELPLDTASARWISEYEDQMIELKKGVGTTIAKAWGGTL